MLEVIRHYNILESWIVQVKGNLIPPTSFALRPALVSFFIYLKVIRYFEVISYDRVLFHYLSLFYFLFSSKRLLHHLFRFQHCFLFIAFNHVQLGISVIFSMYIVTCFDAFYQCSHRRQTSKRSFFYYVVVDLSTKPTHRS